MRIVLIGEDDDFDQFVKEEEVIYVNYRFKISRDLDGYFCENEDYEDRMVEPQIPNPKKDLAKVIDASENLPHHYKEYLALGEEICKFIPFKYYFYFWFEFEPKDVYDYYINCNKSSIE